MSIPSASDPGTVAGIIAQPPPDKLQNFDSYIGREFNRWHDSKDELNRFYFEENGGTWYNALTVHIFYADEAEVCRINFDGTVTLGADPVFDMDAVTKQYLVAALSGVSVEDPDLVVTFIRGLLVGNSKLTGAITHDDVYQASIEGEGFVDVEVEPPPPEPVDNTTYAVNQTAHGLVVGMPVHISAANTWAAASSSSDASVADGIVQEVVDANNFVVRFRGPMVLTTAQWDARTGLTGGLVGGEYYWLHTTAGALTATQPTTTQQCLIVGYNPTTAIVIIGDIITAAVAGSGGSGGSGALVKLASYTVAGSAVTDITFSGLDLSAYDSFELDIKLKNATASTPDISLYYNGDTTATNYYRQMHHVVDTVTTATRTNNGAIDTLGASVGCTADVKIIRDVDGYPRAFYRVARLAVSGITYLRGAHIRNNTANVTSITLSSSVASAFAIGSSVVLYGRTTGSGVPASGTSNPSSPATNTLFFRTDLGLMIYYDGVRWLTTNEYSFETIQGKFAPSGTTAGDYVIYMAPPADYGVYLTRWTARTYAGTVSGANYWTWVLAWTSAANVSTTIASFTTAADSAGTWAQHDQVINAVLNSGAALLNYYNSAKTGSPSGAYCTGQVYFRKIVT